MKNYHVYGIGAALVDTEFAINDQKLVELNIEKGVMTLVDEPRQSDIIDHLSLASIKAKRASGGSVANSIYAISQFGGKTFFSGRLGDDENGEFFRHDMSAAGIETPSHMLTEGTTGKCIVLITPDAERTMNTYLGASEKFSHTELDLNAIASSEYLYIEGYLVTSESGKAAAITAREYAEQHKVKIAMSFSDPGIIQFFKEGIQAMMGGKIDLVFCNEDEALQFTETDNLNDAANELKQYSHQFAITLGAKGALLFDGEKFIDVAGIKTQAIDTNGAGDMFAGAFLYAINHGATFFEAGQRACHAASVTVANYGPRLEKAAFKRL